MLYQLRASGPTDCVDTMLEIRVATKQQLSIMERLIELYLYDLGEFAGKEAGARITFEYDSLIPCGATMLWRRVIDRYTDGQFQEARSGPLDVPIGPTQVFRSPLD